MPARTWVVDLLDSFKVKQIGTLTVSYSHVMVVDPLLVVSHGQYIERWESLRYDTEPFEVDVGKDGKAKGLCLPVSRHIAFGSCAPHYRFVTISGPRLKLGIARLLVPEQCSDVPTKLSSTSNREWPKRYDGERTIPL